MWNIYESWKRKFSRNVKLDWPHFFFGLISDLIVSNCTWSSRHCINRKTEPTHRGNTCTTLFEAATAELRCYLNIEEEDWLPWIAGLNWNEMNQWMKSWYRVRRNERTKHLSARLVQNNLRDLLGPFKKTWRKFRENFGNIGIKTIFKHCTVYLHTLQYSSLWIPYQSSKFKEKKWIFN